jgi:hypothetical protein
MNRQPRSLLSLPAITRSATFILLSCILFAAGMTASAQFQIVGPAPVSATVARQRIRTLLEKVDPGNRQQTLKDIFGLANWYRDLIDEELIAAWQGVGRANLTGVMEPLADPHVAAAVVEFSWRQEREATFTPAYAPMLGRLMRNYPDSAEPFLDDLLEATATGQQALVLSSPEADAVCRILLDLPDIRTFRQSALQILSHYRRDAEDLLDQDLHGDDRDRRERAPSWLADLAAASSGFAAQSRGTAAARPAVSGSMVFRASNADSGFSWAVTADFTGTVAYERKSLKVTVSGCVISRPTSFTSPAEIIGIGAGVSRVTGDKGSWKQQRVAGVHAIRQSVPPGQKVELPPFTLNIPIGDFEIRSGDWLTLSIRLRNIQNGKETIGEVYVHWHSLTEPAAGFPATLPSPTAPAAASTGEQFAGDATGRQALDLFDAKQYAAAKERATAGASSGSAVCMYVLGQIHATGKGAAQDYAEAAAGSEKPRTRGMPLPWMNSASCMKPGAASIRIWSKRCIGIANLPKRATAPAWLSLDTCTRLEEASRRTTLWHFSGMSKVQEQERRQRWSAWACCMRTDTPWIRREIRRGRIMVKLWDGMQRLQAQVMQLGCIGWPSVMRLGKGLRRIGLSPWSGTGGRLRPALRPRAPG